MKALFNALRLDWRRWQNRRARAKRWVRTWDPRCGERSWSGNYMKELKQWLRS